MSLFEAQVMNYHQAALEQDDFYGWGSTKLKRPEELPEWALARFRALPYYDSFKLEYVRVLDKAVMLYYGDYSLSIPSAVIHILKKED